MRYQLAGWVGPTFLRAPDIVVVVAVVVVIQDGIGDWTDLQSQLSQVAIAMLQSTARTGRPSEILGLASAPAIRSDG